MKIESVYKPFNIHTAREYTPYTTPTHMLDYSSYMYIYIYTLYIYIDRYIYFLLSPSKSGGICRGIYGPESRPQDAEFGALGLAIEALGLRL